MGRRVAVCGGREYKKRKTLYGVLDALHSLQPIDHLIVGGAKGADTLAERWAVSRRISHSIYYANWDAYGKQAGHIRNKIIVTDGRPDVCVAFPGGKGTANMRKLCQKNRIDVIEIV